MEKMEKSKGDKNNGAKYNEIAKFIDRMEQVEQENCDHKEEVSKNLLSAVRDCVAGMQLQVENENLKKEIEKLNGDKRNLSEENIKLKEENSKITQEKESLSNKNQELSKKNDTLTARNNALSQEKTGLSKENDKSTLEKIEREESAKKYSVASFILAIVCGLCGFALLIISSLIVDENMSAIATLGAPESTAFFVFVGLTFISGILSALCISKSQGVWEDSLIAIIYLVAFMIMLLGLALACLDHSDGMRIAGIVLAYLGAVGAMILSMASIFHKIDTICITIVMAIAIIISVALGVSAAAYDKIASNTKYGVYCDGFYYVEESDGDITITGFTDAQTRFEIPETLDGKTVTEVDLRYDFMVNGEEKIVSLTLPETLENFSCNKDEMSWHRLAEVYNYSFEYIYESLFSKDELIIHTQVEPSVVDITDDGFVFYQYEDECVLIDYIGEESNVVIGSSYNGKQYNIGAYAFYNKDHIESIELSSDKITGIGTQAFSYCDALVSLTISGGVKWIHAYAFEGSVGLREIKYSGTIKEWNNISKSRNWDSYSYVKVVYCENGELQNR